MHHLRLHPASAACGGVLVAALFLSLGMRGAPGGLTSEQYEILQHMSLVKLPDGAGNEMLTMRISGLNLQLVNGVGETSSTNGLGNLIVGYGELVGGNSRTGSHNLLTGERNSYSSWGGIVVGMDNKILEEGATVTGGESNFARGRFSSVCGGNGNVAEGEWSHAGGGTANFASGESSSTNGGRQNSAPGQWSAVSGGVQNVAFGGGCTVSGGQSNHCDGAGATVSGGCLLTTTQTCEHVP